MTTGQQAPALMIVHGLFGSSRNWQSLGKRFAADFNVIIPDLRNHGDSFRADQMNYPAMAQDLINLLDHLGIEQVHLLGHSMGGKASMLFAHDYPHRIAKLVVADIAPVGYDHNYDDLIEPVLKLDLDSLSSRKEVDEALASSIADARVRMFLLQNLTVTPHGLQWKLNWSVLQQEMLNITGFEAIDDWNLDIETLFIHGDQSNYITPPARDLIEEHFSRCRFRVIANAGHWLHADQPDAFYTLVQEFLRA